MANSPSWQKVSTLPTCPKAIKTNEANWQCSRTLWVADVSVVLATAVVFVGLPTSAASIKPFGVGLLLEPQKSRTGPPS